MVKTTGVTAVHDSDLQQLLQGLGILDDLVEGKFQCAVCGCPVDLDNLGSIFPHDNQIHVSCDNNKCIRVVTSGQLETVDG